MPPHHPNLLQTHLQTPSTPCLSLIPHTGFPLLPFLSPALPPEPGAAPLVPAPSPAEGPRLHSHLSWDTATHPFPIPGMLIYKHIYISDSSYSGLFLYHESPQLHHIFPFPPWETSPSMNRLICVLPCAHIYVRKQPLCHPHCGLGAAMTLQSQFFPSCQASWASRWHATACTAGHGGTAGPMAPRCSHHLLQTQSGLLRVAPEALVCSDKKTRARTEAWAWVRDQLLNHQKVPERGWGPGDPHHVQPRCRLAQAQVLTGCLVAASALAVSASDCLDTSWTTPGGLQDREQIFIS